MRNIVCSGHVRLKGKQGNFLIPCVFAEKSQQLLSFLGPSPHLSKQMQDSAYHRNLKLILENSYLKT